MGNYPVSFCFCCCFVLTRFGGGRDREKREILLLLSPHKNKTFLKTLDQQRLSAGNVLRWDWWIWVFSAIALCAMPVMALASGSVARARGALLSWATTATVLCIISADRQYNISSNTVRT